MNLGYALAQGLAGAAKAGSGIADQQMKEDAENRMSDRKLTDQLRLDAAREAMLERVEERKRAQAASDGQAINAGADQMRLERVKGLIGSQSGTPLTDEQAKLIASTPGALDANGITDRTRAEAYDDKIAVAEGKGLIAQAKELRGQQDVELRREREINRDAKDDANIALQNRRLDQQFEWQETQAGIANRRADFAESNAKRSEEYRATRDEKADEAGKRLAAGTALKDIAAQSKEISVALASGILTPEATKLYESQKHTLDAERIRYQKQLGNMAGLKDEPAKQSDSEVRFDAQGRAYVRGPDGKPMLRDGPKPAPKGGTYGSHNQDAAPVEPSGNKAIQSLIAEKTARMNLRGIDPEIALQLKAEIDSLQKKSSGSSAFGSLITRR